MKFVRSKTLSLTTIRLWIMRLSKLWICAQKSHLIMRLRPKTYRNHHSFPTKLLVRLKRSMMIILKHSLIMFLDMIVDLRKSSLSISWSAESSGCLTHFWSGRCFMDMFIGFENLLQLFLLKDLFENIENDRLCN